MKYKDIDIKTARKCCKQHSYKNKKGMVIPKCEECPLERKNTNGKPGFCWFMLKSLHDNQKEQECDYLKAEYNALMQEDVTKSKEWEEWINKQESQE